MTEHIYVLRNKDTGKWFYEEFHGGSYYKCETDNLELLLHDNIRNYGKYIDLAESWCESWCELHSERYNLNLEVVKIKKTTTYEEC